MAALGGRLGAADLAGYRAHVEEAPASRYRGCIVGTALGLTAGPTLVDVLTRLAASLAPGTAPGGEAYCAYAEALRDAYAARLRGMGEGGGAGADATDAALHEPSRRRGPGGHGRGVDPRRCSPPSAPRRCCPRPGF